MRALVVRLDGFGGVLLAGPAVRAVATRATHVTVMCAPGGASAARLLPHVDDVLVWQAPPEGTHAPATTDTEAPTVAEADTDGPTDAPTAAEADTDGLIRGLRKASYDVALVLTTGSESPLPMATLLRRGHVRRIGADGADRAEDLLDVAHRRLPHRHEAEAALDTAAALGFSLRAGDDGRLRVLPSPDTTGLTGNGPYVVVHPGAGAPARAWDPDRCAEAVTLLADAGHRVVVTGGPHQAALTRHVSGDTAVDLGGRTDARAFAGVLRAADVVVAGDTGPAHLAAATGTPVVSLHSPVVPAEQRRPYGVPGVLLGARGSPCAGTRAHHHHPAPGHPCLNEVTAHDVVQAVRKLLQESA